MTASERRWRRGDQVWITAGEFRDHAGEIVEDAQPGTDRVGVKIDVTDSRQDGTLVSRVPVAWIQPWRYISAGHVAQLELIIAGLYLDGEVREVRTARLARYLLMHGVSIDHDFWRRIAVKIATADDTLPGARLNLLTTVERDHLEAAIALDTRGQSTP